MFYKILHKPTGLYFTPSKGYGNLSKQGKIYQKKPTLDWCTTSRIIIRGSNRNKTQNMLVEKFNLTGSWIDTYVKTPKEEWEIIELSETDSTITLTKEELIAFHKDMDKKEEKNWAESTYKILQFIEK